MTCLFYRTQKQSMKKKIAGDEVSGIFNNLIEYEKNQIKPIEPITSL